MENNATQMATQTFNIWENMEAWDDVMGQMIAFVNDTHADIDMAYEWVCEMMNISTFVDSNIAWDSFYNTWESCDNRNENLYNFAWLTYTDPCTIALQTDKQLMQNHLTDYIESKGYTVAECQRPAKDREFPKTIHGRTFETREEYQEALHEYLNGM